MHLAHCQHQWSHIPATNATHWSNGRWHIIIIISSMSVWKLNHHIWAMNKREFMSYSLWPIKNKNYFTGYKMHSTCFNLCKSINMYMYIRCYYGNISRNRIHHPLTFVNQLHILHTKTIFKWYFIANISCNSKSKRLL